MPTWRRRDLERRSAERTTRIARLVRGELVVAVVALVVAALSLWQALSAQSRADLLAHDLAAAQARLRAEPALAPAEGRSAATAADGAAGAADLPPPPLPAFPAARSGRDGT